MKLTLKELIQEVKWSEIESNFLSIYPEETDYLHYYKKLYWELLNLEPYENTTNSIIEFEVFDEDDDAYYDDIEYGYDDEEGFEMTTEQWKKYLGYYVSPTLFKNLTKPELVAHIFMEATYGGFYELEIHETESNEDDNN